MRVLFEEKQREYSIDSYNPDMVNLKTACARWAWTVVGEHFGGGGQHLVYKTLSERLFGSFLPYSSSEAASVGRWLHPLQAPGQ